MFKKVLKAITPSILLPLGKQVANFKILAFDYGQYRTIRKWECCDKNGNPIPWYTYPAIEFLNSIDMTGYNIFEYGSGFSSLYYSNKAKHVTSIEDNEEWYNRLEKKKRKNINLHLMKDDDYVSSINKLEEKFDLIVIDGVLRRKCADQVLTYVKKQSCSMIIFDNSDWFPNSIRILSNNLNWIRVPFRGFGPVGSHCWETTVFINPDTDLKYCELDAPYGQPKTTALDDY